MDKWQHILSPKEEYIKSIKPIINKIIARDKIETRESLRHSQEDRERDNKEIIDLALLSKFMPQGIEATLNESGFTIERRYTTFTFYDVARSLPETFVYTRIGEPVSTHNAVLTLPNQKIWLMYSDPKNLDGQMRIVEEETQPINDYSRLNQHALISAKDSEKTVDQFILGKTEVFSQKAFIPVLSQQELVRSEVRALRAQAINEAYQKLRSVSNGNFSATIKLD